MPAHTIRSVDRDAKFFTALENGHPLRVACSAAGYKRQVAYRWRRADTPFAARWQEALLIAGDLLEEEVDRRARDGVEQPVFFKGEPCGVKRKYADKLLIARLKALRPELYREQRTSAPARPQTITVVEDTSVDETLLRLIAENELDENDLSPWPRERLAQRRQE